MPKTDQSASLSFLFSLRPIEPIFLIPSNWTDQKGLENIPKWHFKNMVRVRGIEPRPQAWEAHVLPIYYTRNWNNDQ